ncbi:hypothetical protein ACIP5Y_46940 [Nocardia sp. NPDC088792]|uniref:hypothetical protein n=1 Tax=Nocardia sp. NPDC088792 TaxID=3364332 RepID=UPI0037FD99B8
MNLRKGIYTGTVAAAIGIASVTTASPATADPHPAAVGRFHAAIQGDKVVAAVDDGSFTTDPVAGTVALRGADGAVIDTAPMAFMLDGQRYGIGAQVSPDGHTLWLTPQLPDATTSDHPVAQPIASALENQLAMNDLINSSNFGLSAGALIGTIVGAVVGVGAGLAVSGASCVVLSIGCVLAVVPIVTLMGTFGGLLGLIGGGGPGLAVGVWNYYRTLTAPAGQSPYASQIPALANPATPSPAAGR